MDSVAVRISLATFRVRIAMENLLKDLSANIDLIDKAVLSIPEDFEKKGIVESALEGAHKHVYVSADQWYIRDMLKFLL